VAIEVGAALAVAGGLVQALTRNPLADPGILGINYRCRCLQFGLTAILSEARVAEFDQRPSVYSRR
jgi:ABC-type Fe3+-siderophore transport system permease subunit